MNAGGGMFWQLRSPNLKWNISCCSAWRKQYRAYFFCADVKLLRENTRNKINLSHTTQWVKCLFSHSAALVPAHPPALSGNWKTVWCSFSIWTAPQTSAASVTASFVFPIKKRRLLPLSHLLYIHLRDNASQRSFICLPVVLLIEQAGEMWRNPSRQTNNSQAKCYGDCVRPGY